ncbi:transcription factor RFX4 [Lingula anatina]|uniref:Transcription factor RFX4 n=1 Tax=Lingula anatina TaxID=7574 RepID=A0A1S3HQB7_LINAN|nr:transcription factor RFX4 [Lingula anatina]|eukprot:XP_013388232.1 transcription factor RFX4 [Lingula anatina]
MTETLIYKVKRPQRLPITKESCRRLLKYKSNDVNLNTLSCTADCDLENVHLQHARKVMTDMTHDFDATSSSVQRFQRTYSMSLYQSAAAQAPDIVKWLEQNFEEGLNVSVQRCEVYAEYLDFCATCCVDPINAASLGKMLRMVFPGVRTRRLGTRGQSKYHYYGIKIKKKSVSQTPLLSHMSEGKILLSYSFLTEEGSQNSKMSTTGTPGSLISSFSSWDIPGCELFESLDLPGLEGSESDSLSLSADHPVGMRSTEGGGLAAKGGLKHERNSPCQRDSGLPEFPGTERLRVPLHLKEKTTVFLLLYRHHCQRVLDSVVRANFAEVENLLKSFWRSLPLRLQPLLLSPFTVDLILLYDLTLYRMLASTLFPTLCQEMSASLKSELRRFAVDLQRWFEDALRRQPLLLRNKILEGAGFFCRWLKHQTEVCHIVSSASTILQNAAHVSQLRDDWLRLDLPHIARHGRWVLKGEDLRRSGQTEEERLIQKCA